MSHRTALPDASSSTNSVSQQRCDRVILREPVQRPPRAALLPGRIRLRAVCRCVDGVGGVERGRDGDGGGRFGAGRWAWCGLAAAGTEGDVRDVSDGPRAEEAEEDPDEASLEVGVGDIGGMRSS